MCLSISALNRYMSRNKENYNEYMRSYMNARYHAGKTAIFKRLGDKCSSCASIEDLQIDHKEYRLKAFNVSKLWSASEEKFTTEILKCQLLCGTCHKIKTISEGSLRDRDRETVCSCGRMCATIKEYAGHKRWCKTTGTVTQR